jgi:hypothetical protein
MDVLGFSKTYPTRCRECDDEIFFHTNGYGDVVLFDDLGPPWPIHLCYETRFAGRVVPSPGDYRAYMVSVYGQPFEPKRRRKAADWSPPYKSTRKIQRAMGAVPEQRPVDIARCEPANFLGTILEATGFVQDIHAGRSITRFAPVGSVGYAYYHKLLRGDAFTQVTVVDSDLVSYTVLVPLPKVALVLGDIVTLRIKAVEGLTEPLFLCESLSRVRWQETDKTVDHGRDARPRTEKRSE